MHMKCGSSFVQFIIHIDQMVSPNQLVVCDGRLHYWTVSLVFTFCLWLLTFEHRHGVATQTGDIDISSSSESDWEDVDEGHETDECEESDKESGSQHSDDEQDLLDLGRCTAMQMMTLKYED